MPEDVIANAAVEFITANNRHMELAYKIEEVVPRIREQAVDRVLRRVEDRLSGKFVHEGWDVKLLRDKNHRPQAVRARKESWLDRFGDKPETEWRGVRVVANSYTDWSNSNISLTPLMDPDSAQVKEVFRECGLGTPFARWKYHYVELRGELKDWNGSDFAIRAWNEADGIAEELADKISRLCAGIDGLINPPK